MSVVDLNSPDLRWVEMVPAGSDLSTRMCPLWSDDERGLRSVLVEFPAGWRRDRAGHQPAQEEAVVLDGAMRISGFEAGSGHLLVVPPNATRRETSSNGRTLALVWMTGDVGGWQWGEALVSEGIRVVALGHGEVRPAGGTLRGSVDVRSDVGGQTFGHDVDVLWAEGQRWVHLTAGQAAPDVAGQVVLKHWS